MSEVPDLPPRSDPARLRVSDADRHAVAEVLREAAGEGRIDLAELDERLEAAFGARTYADLSPLTQDLPVSGARHQVAPGGTGSPAPRHERSIGLMGDSRRRGVWSVPPRHTAVAVMGSVRLDLREALLPAGGVVIDAVAVMGGVDVWVDARTPLSVDGVGVMGDFSESRPKVAPEVDPSLPRVTVRGLALMGGVSVQRRPLPDPGRGRRGRLPGGQG